MLSKQGQKDLLKALRFSEEEIETIVEGDEEQDVTVPDLKVYSPKEVADMKAAHLNAKKQGFYDAGKEFLIKELKEQHGFDFEGKDAEAFLEAYKTKVLTEANVTPTDAKKRYEEEKKALQTKLQEEQNKAAELSKQIADIQFERQLLASFPKGETILPAEDLLALIKSKMAEKKEGDGSIFTYKGVELKDGEENYLDLSKSVAHVFEKENWIRKVEGQEQPTKKGLGFQDSGSISGVYKSFDELAADLEKRGIEIGSDEANKHLQAALAKNPKLLDSGAAA